MQSYEQLTKEIDNIVQEFDNVEDFIEVNEEKAKRFNKYVKIFYDCLKKTEDESDNYTDSLPELLIDNVDNEQIYQQLQLHYNSAYSSLLKYFLKCSENPDEITFNIEMESKDSKKNEKLKKKRRKLEEESTDDENVFNGNGLKDKNDDNDSDAAIVEEKIDNKKINKKNDTVFGIPDGSDSEISDFDVDENGEDDDEDGDDNDEEAEEENNDEDEFGLFKNEEDDDDDDDDDDDEDEEKESKKKVNKIEKKSDKKKPKNIITNVDDLDSDEVDEDLVDMYGDLGDEKEVLEIGKTAEYKDDFDDIDEEKTEENDKPKQTENKKKVGFKNLFDNNDNSDDDVNENGEKKSSFEKRQEKLKEKVDKIHNAMLDSFENKPWQLTGEITAKSRPQDSLLEEFLQYDHTTRQAPIISNELNAKLEEIIKQRIKDKAFDDVERKVKPVEMNYEYKKQVTLEQEKSKLSLSQVYEQEYLNKAANTVKTTDDNATEVKNPKHEAIRKAMESLFVKLDALSNFHYTPKVPQPELKVVSNMPTISVEEVAPVNVSDANLLAPEEIHKKIDGLPMSKHEEGKKDKHRKLRQKKTAIKKDKAKKEKLLKIKQAVNPDNEKLNKELALEKLKKQSKNMSNNLKVLKKDKKSKVDSSLKSSSAFFKELNDTGINNKSKAKKHKKINDNQKSSKKLKL